MFLGRVRAFDNRCNMVLEEVTEMWVRVPETETKGKTITPLYKDRFVLRMLLGGDSIISILKIKGWQEQDMRARPKAPNKLHATRKKYTKEPECEMRRRF